METGITYIDIVLAVILIAFVVIAIFIDSRSARRSRKTKQDIREEIHSRMGKSSSGHKK